MVAIFHGNNEAMHEGFQAWRRAHPDGFHLTDKGGGIFLAHWTQDKRDNGIGRGCTHQGGWHNAYGDDKGSCYTTAKKVCSNSFQELWNWAASEGVIVKSCAHCATKRFPFPKVEIREPLERQVSPFSLDEQDYIDSLAAALRSIEITEREMDDLRFLYKRTNGIPFDGFDSRDRPQGPTIRSSSTIGSKIKRVLGAPESYYGMTFVGCSKNDSSWYMKDVFRAAIDQSKIFGSDRVVADEYIPNEDEEDGFDMEDAIVDQLLTDDSLTETVREQLIMARVGQGQFRSSVEDISARCRVTGVTVSDLLIASHIKPWRVCDNQERLDGNNGLMLSPHIDWLFDGGYISFADDGVMLVSAELPAEVLTAWSIQPDLRTETLNKHQAKYMAYHREKVFLGMAG